MSSAIQLIGDHQVIHLGSRLVVGIRLVGTIASRNTRNLYALKARPFTRYLAQTLQHLQCDVTLVVDTDRSAQEGLMLQHLTKHHFPVAFHVLHEKPTAVGTCRHGQSVSSNHERYFLDRAAAQRTGRGRILFIDSEINYRFSVPQTLVVESYDVGARRRQHRAARKAARCGGSHEAGQTWEGDRADALDNMFRQSSSPLHGADCQLRQQYPANLATSSSHEEAAMSPKARRGQAHQRDIHTSLQEVVSASSFLQSEVLSANAEGTTSSGGWLGRHDAQRHPVTVPNAGSRPSSEVAAAAAAAEASPLLPQHPVHSGGAATAGSSAPGENARVTTGRASLPAVPAGQPAINMEDYTLIALSEMIAGLAASEVSVHDYLRVEPMVEGVRVPFHGIAHYLPMENCDHIDVIDWEYVTVKEKAEMVVPDVEEQEAHKGFFR